jgi:hypothetical protein
MNGGAVVLTARDVRWVQMPASYCCCLMPDHQSSIGNAGNIAAALLLFGVAAAVLVGLALL